MVQDLKERAVGGRALQAMVLQAMPNDPNHVVQLEATPPPTPAPVAVRSKRKKGSVDAKEESLPPPAPVIEVLACKSVHGRAF